MLFSKKNKFLKVLFLKHHFLQEKIVKGSILELELKCNYKKVHEIAKYWEVQGCIVSRSERGGNLEYQITSLGELAYEKISKQEKSIKLFLVIVTFCICVYFFI